MGEENIDVDKLINEIEKRPALWDQSRKEYCDRLQRKEKWEEVINVFSDENTSIQEKKQLGELLHKKWKNIRDRYSRDLLSQRGKSGDGAKKKAPYVYSKQLRFLKDTITPKETTDTLKEVNIESGGSTVVEESTTTSTATPTSKKRLIGKKRSNLIEEKLLCSLETYEKRMSSDCLDKDDDNRQFLLSLVPTLASLPKLSNTKCRIEILQVMSKYESWAAQQTQQQPGYIPQHIQQQACYIPQVQQHPSYSTQQFQQQQGYTPYTQQNQVANQNEQPTHSADLHRTNHKRSLAEHQQEQSRNPEASDSAGDSVQSYLSHFSGDDDSQFSIF